MRISDWSSDVCSSDLHFTHRTTARCISPTSAAVSISCYRQGSVVASGVDSWSVSPAFRFSLPSGWNLNILGTYSQSNNTISNLTYAGRSEEHTSELQSLMRISYAVFCLKKNNKTNIGTQKD